MTITYDQNQLLKQRLTSPYLQQQRLNNDDQSSLPLYTNEYFIRNGLLNHNDGPAIHNNHLSYSSSSPSSSPMNISLPLALLSNRNYLFTALSSNYTARRSQSNMELNMMKYLDETESIIVRRNKVQTWKRDNILQQRTSSVQESSEYHRSTIIQTSSSTTSKNDKTMRNTEESIGWNKISLQTCNKEEGNEKPSEIKITNDLFPMIKVLGRK